MKYQINNRIRWLITAVFFLLSCFVVVWARRVALSNISGNALLEMVDSLTKGNKARQVVTAEILFISGRMIAQTAFKESSHIIKAAWAFPIAVILWTVESLTLLLIGIPYNRISMGLFYFAVLLTVAVRAKDEIKQIDMQDLIRECIVFLGLSFIFSSGVLPTYMSSDSYYYVMQYGQILAKAHSLSFDTAGAFMTWTGITPAILSSLAAFCSFETIIVLFYHMMCSMMICFCYSVYDEVKQDRKESEALFIAVLSTVCLMIIPSFELLSSWIISNAYCMFFLFFFMQGSYTYANKGKGNKGILLIVSGMGVCLALSRAEMCVTMAVLIYIASCLDMNRREMLFLSVPMAISQILFLIRLDWQMTSSGKGVFDNMLTPAIQAVMVAAVIGIIIYVCFMDRQFFRFLHDKMKWVVFAVLPAACVGICAPNPEKWGTSIKATWYNLTTQFWGLTPLLILILAVLVLIFVRKLNFQLMFSFGYIFASFLICLARKQPLRDGFGDSCNRVLISALPVVLFALLSTLFTCKSNRIEKSSI